ncbi:MAG TPA: hypothetical protein VK158_03995 [Acidobacteriota bacterium]|nr:hypothetical protein [Acidobacteriota bacterium]
MRHQQFVYVLTCFALLTWSFVLLSIPNDMFVLQMYLIFGYAAIQTVMLRYISRNLFFVASSFLGAALLCNVILIMNIVSFFNLFSVLLLSGLVFLSSILDASWWKLESS